jgi:uncharacterized protein YpmB
MCRVGILSTTAAGEALIIIIIIIIIIVILWALSKTHKFQRKKKVKNERHCQKVSQVQVDLEEFREITLLGFWVSKSSSKGLQNPRKEEI